MSAFNKRIFYSIYNYKGNRQPATDGDWRYCPHAGCQLAVAAATKRLQLASLQPAKLKAKTTTTMSIFVNHYLFHNNGK